MHDTLACKRQEVTEFTVVAMCLICRSSTAIDVNDPTSVVCGYGWVFETHTTEPEYITAALLL